MKTALAATAAQFEISDYLPGTDDRESFARLNVEWLEEFFSVEPEDERLFADPEGYLLDKGGHILLARMDGKAVGTCALRRIDDTTYELTKMCVTRHLRGAGIGRKLVEATIARAREIGARTLLICTNSALKPAIALYESVGFRHTEHDIGKKYARTDTALELDL